MRASQIEHLPKRTDQAAALRALMDEFSRPMLPEPKPGAVRPRGRIITLASGKGGVGKTTTAIALAMALVEQGSRTVLVDADMVAAAVEISLGLSPGLRIDAVLAASDPARRIRETIAQGPGGIAVVPGPFGSAQAADISPAGIDRLVAAIASLASEYDAVVVDAGAGPTPIARSLLAAADAGLLVTTDEPVSIALTCALARTIAAQEKDQPPRQPTLVCSVCRAESQARAIRTYRQLDNVARHLCSLRPALAPGIREDARCAAALRSGRAETLLAGKLGKDARVLATALASRLAITRSLPRRHWWQKCGLTLGKTADASPRPTPPDQVRRLRESSRLRATT